MNSSRAVHSGVLAALCLTILQGCAGSGQGLDANGRPIGEGGSGSVPLSDDFGSLQANIFTPICSVCHQGGGAPEGLRLDSANAYNLLVSVPSTEQPSIMRVKPSDPDSSYLIQKLEGHAATGARMPLGGPYLSSDTVAFVRQWITNGAPPAGASAPAQAAFAVKSVVPDESEPVSASPAQIAISFTHDLDVTQLAGLNATIRGADGTATGTRLSVPAGNARVLLVSPLHELKPGRYQLLMSGPVGAVVGDMSGHALVLGTLRGNESEVSTFEVEVLP